MSRLYISRKRSEPCFCGDTCVLKATRRRVSIMSSYVDECLFKNCKCRELFQFLIAQIQKATSNERELFFPPIPHLPRHLNSLLHHLPIPSAFYISQGTILQASPLLHRYILWCISLSFLDKRTACRPSETRLQHGIYYGGFSYRFTINIPPLSWLQHTLLLYILYSIGVSSTIVLRSSIIQRIDTI